MTAFTLSRGAIHDATGWGYHRIRTLIEKPYQLERRLDLAGPKGGGKTERFRLADILARARTKRAFTEGMEAKLFTADAAFRQQEKNTE
jgi:hypothetical protein